MAVRSTLVERPRVGAKAILAESSRPEPIFRRNSSTRIVGIPQAAGRSLRVAVAFVIVFAVIFLFLLIVVLFVLVFFCASGNEAIGGPASDQRVRQTI